MKNLFAASAMATVLLAGAAHAHDKKGKHDKRDVVATYDYNGFDKIEIAGVYELDIQQGNSFSIRTEATEEQAKKFEVRLRGNTLILGSKESEKRWNNNNNYGSVLAVITMPRLSDLEIAGVANGKISAFDGGDLNVDIAGVGDITLSGTCDHLEIDVAGVGEVDARDLKCDHVDAELGGVGELTVYASESVDASAGGVGTINVYGNPNVQSIDDGFLAKVRIR